MRRSSWMTFGALALLLAAPVRGASQLAQRQLRPDPPLLRAIAAGTYASVQALLRHGADPNSANDARRTALMTAVIRHVRIARLLLKHGAAVNRMDIDGHSELVYAVQGGRLDSVLLLLQARADPNGGDAALRKDIPLQVAVRVNNLACLRLLLAHGANPNAGTQNGWTALMEAAATGNRSAAEILFAHHADPSARRPDGWTGLMAAIEGEHEMLLRLLLAHGANPNSPCRRVGTALVFASAFGTDGMVGALLDHGADPNARGPDGGTSLIRAATFGHDSILRMLLARRADVDAQTSGGNTALMEAVMWGHARAVRMLVAAHAQTSLKNNVGETALALAADNPEIAALLRAGGASN